MSDLRTAIREREPVAGTWVAIGHPGVAEIGASLDFEFVLLDLEHTPMGLDAVENAARAVDAAPGETETETVVRVPWNDHVAIKRVLDLGVAGVMAPMVDSAADARALVDAVRYPPAGSRGLAAARASNYALGFEEYVETANDSVLVIAQVETLAGVENAAAIAAVDGIDALFVGPADLSANMDRLGEYDDAEFSAAVRSVLDAAHDLDVPVGTLATSGAAIDDWTARGFDFLVVGSDIGYLTAAGLAAKERFEKRVGERESRG